MWLRFVLAGVLVSCARADVLEDAKRAFDAGKYAQAAALFEQSHRQTPRCDTLFFLGLAQYRLKQFSAAVVSFRSAGECDPKFIEPQLALGEAYAERGNDVEALAAFEKALQIRPREPSALRGAASACLRLQENQKASELLRELIKAEPTDPEAHADLGAASVATGDREGAEVEFQAALRLNSKLPSALLGLGSLYLKNGDESRAVPLLEQAARAAPKAYEPRFLLGSAYNRLGKFAEARVELESAAKLGGEEAEVYYHLARAYGGLGKQDERSKALARFAELTKKTKEAANAQREAASLMDRAKTEVESGDLTAAVADMEKARELRPSDSRVLFRLGSLHYDLKHYDQARSYAQEAISLAPSEWLYHYLLANVERGVGNWRKAAESLDVAVRLNPSAAEAFNARGEVALREGDNPLALRSFQKAAELDPKEAVYRSNLEAARRAGK